MTSFSTSPKLATMQRLCKRVTLAQKLKLQKPYEKRHYDIIRVCAKNGFKKHVIFEKWQVFEDRQNWPLCKGYRLCKRVTLAQKLKFQETGKNDTRTPLELLCAKNGFKKHLIFEKWQVFQHRQNWTLCKAYRLCKRVTLAQKLKFQETGKNDTRTPLELLCAKNGFKKHLIFEKWQVFQHRQNWPLCKAYRLCKRVTLAQKLQFQKPYEKRH